MFLWDAFRIIYSSSDLKLSAYSIVDVKVGAFTYESHRFVVHFIQICVMDCDHTVLVYNTGINTYNSRFSALLNCYNKLGALIFGDFVDTNDMCLYVCWPVIWNHFYVDKYVFKIFFVLPI